MPVSALSDLGKNFEVSMSKSSPSLTQIRPLPTKIFCLRSSIFSRVLVKRGGRVRGLELLSADIALVDVVQEVEVIIKKVLILYLAEYKHDDGSVLTNLRHISQTLHFWQS